MATQMEIVRHALTIPAGRTSASTAGNGRSAFRPRGRWHGAGRPHAPRWQEERQRSLLAMLPLVKRVAFEMRAHLPAHIEMDDLIGAGALGLVEAVGKFDPSRQVKLASYARHRIRGSMLDGLRALDPASRDVRKKIRKVERVYEKLEAKLERPVSDEEVCAELDISLEKWQRLIRELEAAGFNGRSRMQSANWESATPTLEDFQIATSQPDPLELCYQREQRDILNRALQVLSGREQRIIALYYCRELTMKQIADRLGVGESRISQLHKAALDRLRTNAPALLRSCHPSFGAGPHMPARMAA